MLHKTYRNLTFLYILFVVSLLVSNVVTSKLITTGLQLWGVPVILPGAVLCYAFTFLITDIIGETWGKDKANECVKMGFIAQIVAMILILLTKYFPAYDEQIQISYNNILGQNYIFVIGSLCSYWCSQTWDVFIFHKIRNIVLRYNNGSNKHRWIWNNLSTFTSQIIDTIVFIGICFGIGFGWFSDKTMLPTLLVMMLGQYIFKVILAILDTPIFYVFTKTVEEKINYENI